MSTDEIRNDPILRDALDYWSSVRDGADIPIRERLDPVDMPPRILPYLVLADYLSPQGMVRYRLVGGEMSDRWGVNFAGRTSRDLFSGSYLDYLESMFALSYAERRPIYSESQFRWDVQGWVRTRRIMMPIAAESDGPPVQNLIVQVWPQSNASDLEPISELINDVNRYINDIPQVLSR